MKMIQQKKESDLAAVKKRLEDQEKEEKEKKARDTGSAQKKVLDLAVSHKRKPEASPERRTRRGFGEEGGKMARP